MMSNSLFEGYPCDGRVYLVRALTPVGGFYVCNNEPIYAAKVDDTSHPHNAVETECLQLRLGVKLKVSDGGAYSETQYFDLIRLISYQSDKELTAFIDLCTMHAKGSTTLSFEEFFYSLNDLFRPLRKQHLINAMGLYAELTLIDTARKILPGSDISQHWQLSGEESKYDFAFPQGNIEVKAASAQTLNVQIKHDQLFNDDPNHLAVVLLERVPNGETLGQLVERLTKGSNCFTDFRSQAELTKQLLRVDEKGLNTPYLVRGIRCYPVDEIDCFGYIPDRVSDLNYRLNLADLEWISLRDALMSVLAV